MAQELPSRIIEHTAKANDWVLAIRWIIFALGGEQRFRRVVAPRTTSQNALGFVWSKPIGAPFPDIAAQIINAKTVWSEGTNWSGAWETIPVAGNHIPFCRFLPNAGLLTTEITCALRRRPLAAPRIDSRHTATALLWSAAKFLRQSNCGAPFQVGRQTIDSRSWQTVSGLLMLGQPSAESIGIIPIHSDDRVQSGLGEAWITPVAAALFPAIDGKRHHAIARIKSGGCDEGFKIPDARFPDTKKHPTTGDGDKLHA